MIQNKVAKSKLNLRKLRSQKQNYFNCLCVNDISLQFDLDTCIFSIYHKDFIFNITPAVEGEEL